MIEYSKKTPTVERFTVHASEMQIPFMECFANRDVEGIQVVADLLSVKSYCFLREASRDKQTCPKDGTDGIDEAKLDRSLADEAALRGI